MESFFKELKTIEINGHEVKVELSVEVENDNDVSLGDLSDDVEEQNDYMKRMERGDLMVAVVFVRARALGIEGSDVLGGVFVTEPSDVTEAVQYHAMIESATDDLKKNILDQAKELAKFV